MFKTALPKFHIIMPVFALLVCLLFVPPAGAARQYDEYQVKAAFLYNLTNFIYWPQESFANQSSPFVIAILGHTDPFADFLKNLTRNEFINSHPIQIVQVADIREFSHAHILFITEDMKYDIADILPRTKQLGLLTVADYEGFAEDGGGINLCNQNNRLKLLLNTDVLEQNGLRCSSKLLRLATIVTGEAK